MQRALNGVGPLKLDKRLGAAAGSMPGIWLSEISWITGLPRARLPEQVSSEDIPGG